MKLAPVPRQSPAEQRAFLLHYARVLLREYQARGRRPGWAWLLRGASNARREALAIDVRPAQREMFT